jgi:hypothetical protein
MGDVATSAAGDSNLGEKFRSALEDRDFIFGISLSTGNCGKKACRAASDNGDLFPCHRYFYTRLRSG